MQARGQKREYSPEMPGNARKGGKPVLSPYLSEKPRRVSIHPERGESRNLPPFPVKSGYPADRGGNDREKPGHRNPKTP